MKEVTKSQKQELVKLGLVSETDRIHIPKLIALLPKTITVNNDTAHLNISYDGEYVLVTYDVFGTSRYYYHIEAYTLLDALYEMVLKLHEEKYL